MLKKVFVISYWHDWQMSVSAHVDEKTALAYARVEFDVPDAKTWIELETRFNNRADSDGETLHGRLCIVEGP